MKIVSIRDMYDADGNKRLTCNKIYEVFVTDDYYYYINDDSHLSKYQWWHRNYFKTICDVREEKLNKLLEYVHKNSF